VASATHSTTCLSERVDEYVTKLLTSLDAPMDVWVTSPGAFRPEPPDYTEPLLELVHRLASSAAVVSRLPRQMDAIMFQRLTGDAMWCPDRRRLQLDADCERSVRLIGAFLRGQLPAPVEEVMSTSSTGRRQ
jgi:hypothetical protein